MGYILKNNIDLNQYDSFECLYESLKDELPEELSNKMRIACEFNRLVYVARVRYNHILSNGENSSAKELWEQIENNLLDMLRVDIDEVLQITNINNPKLRGFLINFKEALLANDLKAADNEIINREISIKTRSRAKLCNCENYKKNAWIGGTYLDYRFPDARRIINDIYKGEKQGV